MYKLFFIAILAAGIVYLGSWVEKKISLSGLAAKSIPYGRMAMILSYVLATIAFCVFAGVRATSVGTDVEMYVVPSFDSAVELDLISFFMEGVHTKWMPLSNIFFWVVPNVTHSLFWLLFFIHVVIVIPLFVTVRIMFKDHAWFAVLIFGIALFPMSLNIMRQFMGMSFIIVSYLFVRKRKPLLFLLFIAIAVLIHESCLLGLLVYPIWLLSSGNLKRITVNPVVLAVVALTLVQVFFPALNLIAPYVGKLGSYINGYIATSQGSGGQSELRYIVFLCAVFGICYCWFTRKGKRKSEVPGEASGLAAIVLFGVAAFSMCLYSVQLFRLGIFFLYFAVLLLPFVRERIELKRDRVQYAVIVICFLALFSQWHYGSGAHEVVPYVIDLAGKF